MHQQVNRKASLLGWIICGLGALFYCYEYLLRIEPSVMVQQIRAAFDMNADMFGFVAGLYYFAYTPMQLVVGVVTDMYGPRRVLTFAVTCCVIGSFIFSMTHSIYIAAAARFLIGFGSAFAFVGVLKLAAIWLPQNRFAMFAGIATALGMLGAIAGDIGLARLVQTIGWRETLNFGTILGIGLIPLIWFIVRDKRPDANNDGLEKKSYKETFQNLLLIVKNRQMWLAGTIGGLLFLSLSVFGELWGTQFIHVAFNMPAHDAAKINSVVFLGWLVGAPLMGFWSDYIRRRKVVLMTGSFVAALMLTLLIYLPLHSNFAISALLFLSGLFAGVQVNCFALGRENANHELAASAVAFVNMVVMLGGFIFQPLFGRMLDWFWDGTMAEGLRVYSAGDYRLALILLPAAFILSGILSFFIKETYAANQVTEKKNYAH